MPNHFHLLVRIIESENFKNDIVHDLTNTKRKLTPIEKAFRDFFASYAKAINKSYKRTGALFQARFKRKLIVDDNYLTRLIAYIHLNPVRAGICKKPEEYTFSSYNSILSNKETKICRDKILEWFGDKKEFIEFHKFYSDYQRERDFLFKIDVNQSQIYNCINLTS
jgi:putative transposase